MMEFADTKTRYTVIKEFVRLLATNDLLDCDEFLKQHGLQETKTHQWLFIAQYLTGDPTAHDTEGN